VDQVLGEEILQEKQAAHQGDAEQDEAGADHLEQQRFHRGQRRNAAQEAARLAMAQAVILNGQQHRLDRRQRQQRVGQDGDQDVQFQRPLTGIGDDAFRREQQPQNQHQGVEGQHDDAEILDRPDHGRRQQHHADQPAGEGQGVKKAEIQTSGLEHGLTQDHGVQQRPAPTQCQRAALGAGRARAGVRQARAKPAAGEQIEQNGQTTDNRVHHQFRAWFFRATIMAWNAAGLKQGVISSSRHRRGCSYNPVHSDSSEG